jgi:hypothetical protein
MDKQAGNRIARRDLLRLVASLGVAATALAVQEGPAEAAAQTQPDRGKRKAQYQANSQEIQTFYRVNRYPKK